MFGKKNNEAHKTATDVFDWDSIPFDKIDGDEVAKFIGSTDQLQRQFPLAIAAQVQSELNQKFLAPVKLDALQMAEVRGGCKALARFAQIYTSSLRENEIKLNVPEDDNA